MESTSLSDDCGSSYASLPAVPEQLVNRTFLLSDGNVEITSMDIAPHGAFVVVGSSSGMVLLFDMSNPYSQKDGLLIGQIRARGMHTNLILTVKFSEDGRFVFAGVSKGSSEMLAIDLGKVLVDWHSGCQIESGNGTNRESSETLQQLQLQSTVTFSFSDAKLRGFGAVVRMDHPRSSEGQPKSTSASFSDSSALYRLACGRGIKNVHIWHFTVGYLTSTAKVGEQTSASCDGPGQRMMHGKWEYVCDVASNGNTITHIEFRQAGNELISKSAGMSIRVWDLRGNETLNGNIAAASAAAADPSASEDDIAPANAAPATSTSNWLTIKPTYVDISNSQDVKCLLPVGTCAYGGTYQFAVLNTSAPKEANRDVLELPERFSGDGAAASGGIPSNASSNNLLRGRRITREIEQVICTDEGSHALLLCADGGVVYYCAPTPAARGHGEEGQRQWGGESDAEGAAGGARNGASALLELPDLFRQKDVQQHTGSWALRRVGRQGLVVLLRAYPDAKSNAVAVEARLLSEHLPEDRQRETDSGGTALQLLYYQDSSTHSVQEAARKVWKTLTTPAPKRCVSSVNFGGAPRVVKKAKVVGEGEVEAVQPFRRKTVSVVSGEKSPRSSVLNQASLEKKSGGGILVTPAAPPSASKLNKLSPQDATERLISSVGARGAEEGGVDGSAVSPVSGPVPIPSFRSSRISSRQSSTSSFAKLRALRDDDSSADEEGEGVPPMHSAQKRVVSAAAATFAQCSYKDLSVGPAPKVRRLVIPPLSSLLASSATVVAAAAAVPLESPKSSPCLAQHQCGSLAAARFTSPGEAVLGLAGGRTLGSTGLQRLGVILMEQDRLKAQFLLEVTCASSDEDAVSQVVSRYRATSEELVRRQQLELQGACAIDSICSSSSGVVASHCSWGEDLKVVFRHEDIYSQVSPLCGISINRTCN